MPRLQIALVAGTMLLIAGPLAAAEDEALTPEGLRKWGGTEHVFTGKLKAVQAGPVGLSNPPVRTHRLVVEVGAVLRGSVKAGESVALSHSVRQQAEPVFPAVGSEVLISANSSRGGTQVETIEAADEANVAAAQAACGVPLGWTFEGDALISPWASIEGGRKWAAEAGQGMRVCAKTGRPALLAGEGIELTAEPVPPKQSIQWTNPDGDGLYKITVTNTTDAAREVPALRRRGEEIAWRESLVMLCQGKAYVIPAAGAATGAGTEAVTLEAGERVSTVVNAFLLDGPQWPRGGYRIEFRFCLGEVSATHSFYYMSRHHDAIRAAAQANEKGGVQ